jgi:hypothetical protein
MRTRIDIREYNGETLENIGDSESKVEIRSDAISNTSSTRQYKELTAYLVHQLANMRNYRAFQIAMASLRGGRDSEFQELLPVAFADAKWLSEIDSVPPSDARTWQQWVQCTPSQFVFAPLPQESRRIFKYDERKVFVGLPDKREFGMYLDSRALVLLARAVARDTIVSDIDKLVDLLERSIYSLDAAGADDLKNIVQIHLAVVNSIQ